MSQGGIKKENVIKGGLNIVKFSVRNKQRKEMMTHI
jgi:hypothetical protein